MPIVGNPGETVNILSLELRSCNAEMVPPCRNKNITSNEKEESQ